MPPNPSDAAIARRDALLDELDAYHEHLVQAVQTADEEALERLMESRHDVIERLVRIVKSAPIPPDVGAKLAEQDKKLQELLKLEMSGVQTNMGQKARLGNAVLRYRRSS